jgi:hypothetical protein
MNREHIILTRYLYIQDEVEKALLVSILNKSDDSIFWAYELFYSGIGKKRFFKLIWKIYYDFFAVLNPSFESYLAKKQKEPIKNNLKLISTIIQNFLIRPFNTDIFLLRQLHKIYDLQPNYENISDTKYLEYWIKNNDNNSILYYILGIEDNYLDIYENIIDILNNFGNNLNKNNLLKSFKKYKKINLLVKVLILLSKNKNNISKGKNFYVIVEPEQVVQYETLKTNFEIRNYRILKQACICGINDLNYLHLFNLKRDKLTNQEIENIFNTQWLYYASFSQIWQKRIIKYNGFIDHNNKKVIFENEELEEEFRDKYDYEFEEQTLQTKNKVIMNIQNNINKSWNNFSKNNILEIDDELINEINNIKIIY